MPTLLPTAEENLHPNRLQRNGENNNKNGFLRTIISTPTTQKSSNKTGLTKHSISPTLMGRMAATPQQKYVHSKTKFRENAPHVAGKRVGFHHSTKDSNTGITSNSDSKVRRRGGLAAFARIYSQNSTTEPDDETDHVEPIHREFTHATNQEVKQSLAYSNWINHLVSPLASRTALLQLSPRDSFSALLMHQARSTEIHSAFTLFNSPSMMTMRDVIEREVGRGRLVMRLDRDFENVMLRQELVGVLMSYCGRWLGLGLGVVLGLKGEVMWEATSRYALEKIITERILSDPSTHKKYTGGGKVKTPSGQYATALRKKIEHHALTKMLTLVTFLDTAKMQRILSDDPCLFQRSSKVKSSNQVLAAICRLCFAREEFITHHMAHLGISVHHIQNPLEEYEFYVRDLAVDLKDGVRLAKMTELVTGRPVLHKMRLPATSRGHRIHNVGEVLSTLIQAGVRNIQDITASHIVDAHQPRILQLFWSTIVRFQIGKLDGSLIEEEIRGIEHWKEKRDACAGSSIEYSRENTVKLVEKKHTGSFERIKLLLLRWCQAICSYYKVPVDNFAGSFSDGKVLCLLVSFYHPTLLASRDILPTVLDIQSKLKPGARMDNQLVEMALQNERYNLSLALNRIDELGGIPRLISSKNILLPPDEHTTVLCVSFLFSRLTETSAEIVAAREIQKWWQHLLLKRKNVAASFLFRQWNRHKEDYFRNKRSKFTQPIQVIETFFKEHEVKFKELSWMRRNRNISASIIQRNVRTLLASKSYQAKLACRKASILIQSNFRMMLAKKEVQRLRMQKSSIIIQKLWKSNRILCAYQFVRRGVIAFQSLWRCYCCHCQYKVVLSKCIISQSAVRRYLVIAHMRTVAEANFGRYLRWRSEKHHPLSDNLDQNDRDRDEARVQPLFHLLESQGAMNLHAVSFYSALHIQCTYRGYSTRNRIKAMGLASISIQRIWRRYKAQLAFGFDLMDIINTQSIGRRYLAQRAMRIMHDTATIVQRIWRGYKARLAFDKALIDIITVQRVARKYTTLARFTKQQSASKLLQSIWRGHLTQKQYCKTLASIVKAQSIARRSIYQKYFMTHRDASILIQSTLRQWLANQFLTKVLRLVTIMQSTFRAFVARRMFKSKQESAARIQFFSRRVIAKITFERIQQKEIMRQARLSHIVYRSAARTIQVCYRLRQLYRSHEYSTMIQRTWRGYLERQQYRRSQIKIIMIQTQARRYIAEKAFASLTFKPVLPSQHVETTSSHLPCQLVRDVSGQQCSGHMLSTNTAFNEACSKSLSYELQNITLPECGSTPIQANSNRKAWRSFASVNHTTEVNPPPAQHEIDYVDFKPNTVVHMTSTVTLMDPSQHDASTLFNHPHKRTFDDNPHAGSHETQEPKGSQCNNSFNERATYNVTQYTTCHEPNIAANVKNEASSNQTLNQSSGSKSAPSVQQYSYQISEASATVQDMCPFIGVDNTTEDHEIQEGNLSSTLRSSLERVSTAPSLNTPEMNICHGAFDHLHQEIEFDSRLKAKKMTIDCQQNICPSQQHTHDEIVSSVSLDALSPCVNQRQNFGSPSINPMPESPFASILQESAFDNDESLSSAESVVTDNTPIINFRDQANRSNRSSQEEPTQAAAYLSKDESITLLSKKFQRRKGNRQVSVMTLCDDEETFYSTQEEVSDQRHDDTISTAKNERAECHPKSCDSITVPNNPLQQTNLTMASARNSLEKNDDLQKVAEVKTHGVHTRSKLMLLAALEDSRPKDIKQPLTSILHYSAEEITTRSRSSSLDLGLTYKALAVIKNSQLMSEVKEAVKTLERTTHGSKECCKYFAQASGQNMLCSLITSCNRCSPHLELIHVILLTLTNVAKYRSTVRRLASNEVVEVIIYVCQMYRDKAKLLSLSCSLLQQILKSDDHIKASYSTQTQKKRLRGILSLCKKRTRADVGNGYLEKGIASLENVIHMAEQH